MVTRTNIKHNGVKVLAFTAALGIGSVFATMPAFAAPAAQECLWKGSNTISTEQKMSTATNWDNCGGSTPKAGDTVVFKNGIKLDSPNDASKIVVSNITNDLNVDFGGIKTINDEVTHSNLDYLIDKISFADNATLNISTRGLIVIKENPIFKGSVTLAGPGAMMVNKSEVADIEINGELRSAYVVGGAGGAGGGYNTKITPLSGINLYTKKKLIIGDKSIGSILSVDQAPADIVIGVDGALSIEGSGDINSNIVINSSPKVGGPSIYIGQKVNLTGKVTLVGGDSFCSLYTKDSELTISGELAGKGFSLKPSGDSLGKLNIKPKKNDTDTKQGVAEIKRQDITEAGDKPDERLIVLPNQTVTLNGTRGYVNVYNEGILKGNSTIKTSLYVDAGGVVAPGLSPGKITTGSLLMFGTYDFEILNKDKYDQIVNNGTIDLDEKTSELKVSLLKDAVVKKGDQFVIIDNTNSQTEVKGTFKGYPEGAKITVGKNVFAISYKGGKDNNDIVLTAIKVAEAPKTPNTGIAQFVAANPAVVAVAGLIAISSVAVVAKKRK